jgi:hypothetical protein
MKMRRATAGALVLGLAVFAAGCDLDLADPNFPTTGTILGNAAGVKSIGVGLQAEYSNQIGWVITSAALVADEIGAGAAAFQNYKDADAGDPLDPNTGLSGDPWSGMYRVITLSNELLAAIPTASFVPGTASGLSALAKFYKGMAIGNLAMLYEQLPVETGLNNLNAEFLTRAAALQEALRLLNEARDELIATPASEEFENDVLADGFDLENTIDAMIARFALVAGDLAQAAAAAQRVSPAVTSEYRFSTSDGNPIFNIMYRSGNAWQMRPEQAFRLDAEAGDARVDYWVVEAEVPGHVALMDSLASYGPTANPPIPAYTYDEMRLIQAEVLARNGQLQPAIDLINEVRTQCAPAGTEPEDPMPCLDPITIVTHPTQEAVLDEILWQRRYEFFLLGLYYEDLRRFNEPLKYDWIPLPTSECQRNTNAPCEG